MRLVLSHTARRDLKAIARYSEREWGAARKALYMAAIRERFVGLLRHPQRGTERDDLDAGYRCISVGRHLINYRIADDDVIVIRVLHQRMDVRTHL